MGGSISKDVHGSSDERLSISRKAKASTEKKENAAERKLHRKQSKRKDTECTFFDCHCQQCERQRASETTHPQIFTGMLCLMLLCKLHRIKGTCIYY